MAGLLPLGKQTFTDANGVPLAGGSVAFYIPSTTTPKQTWQDPAATILNTNPVALDSAGQAVIYGTGAYRQVVRDYLGNLVWDQLTADPNLLPAASLAQANYVVQVNAGGTGYDLIAPATFAGSLLSLPPLYKTTNYTLVKADASRLVRLNGTFPLTLTAATTLGAGWSVTLSNEGTGIVTVTPNGSEAIDGVAGNLALLPKQRAYLICDGTGFRLLWIDREPLVAVVSLTAAVAFVDLPLLDGYTSFDLLIDGLSPTTNGAVLGTRFSIDGTTFISSNTYNVQTLLSSGTSTGSTSTATNIGQLTGALGNSGNAATIRGAISPGTASEPARQQCQASFSNASGVPENRINSAGIVLGARAVAVRLIMDTGTIAAGRFALRGVAK